ncbi:MAG: hypothetical protein HC875_29770 [Anaerolineales bacterium]|nr:hypothetical protein [Anaerolineales bacterium]
MKPLFFDADNKPSFLPIDFRDRYEGYILKAGDILISMTGTIGKTDYGNVCIIDKEKEYLLNQRVGKFFFTTKNVNRKFIYYLANQYFFKESILKNSAGGVRQANISSQQIESIKIPLPDLATQERIVAQIEREQALVKANRELIEIFEQKIKGRIAKVWGE